MPDKHLMIQDMSDSDRPRERLLQYGASALSNAELLAIILRTGTAAENVLHLSERILAQYNGLQGLAQAAPADLLNIKGLGTAKIAQVCAAVELGNRLMTQRDEPRPIINTAADAARLVMDMRLLSQEHVRVMLLDNNRRVQAITTVYMGTVNASLLRVAEVFREAVVRNCPAIILVHNHPSGDPAPSPEDIELTRTLIAGGRLLDITLLDHIIIGDHAWSSLKELGLAFQR